MPLVGSKMKMVLGYVYVLLQAQDPQQLLHITFRRERKIREKDGHTFALYFSSSETTTNKSSLPGLVTTYVTTCNIVEHEHEYFLVFLTKNCTNIYTRTAVSRSLSFRNLNQ